MTEQTTQTSEGTVVQAPFTANGGSGQPDIAALIPEEYRKKEWVANALRTDNPLVEIIKQNENAQALIGKKADAVVVPKPDAAPEEWSKYFEQTTKAYTPDMYTFQPTPWADDEKEIGQKIEAATAKVVLDTMAKSAKENGLTPIQLRNMKIALDKASLQLHKEQSANWQEQVKKYDEDFQKRAADAFGEKKDTILSGGKALLDQHVPDNLKGDLKNLDNRALVILAAALGSVASKHIAEDTFNTSGSSTTAISEKSIREEGRRLMAFTDAKGTPYQDITHPLHDEYKRRVNETFAQLGAIKK